MVAPSVYVQARMFEGASYLAYIIVKITKSSVVAVGMQFEYQNHSNREQYALWKNESVFWSCSLHNTLQWRINQYREFGLCIRENTQSLQGRMKN